MQVCVTGATGFIGRYLIDVLCHQGHSVRVLTRRDGHIFPADVQVVKGDLTRADCALDQFMDGCEVLFHCAGEVRDVKSMRLLHVDGTKRLIQSVFNEFSRTNRKVHWIQLSSVGAYGPPVGKPQAARVVTEDTRSHPANEYEITKTVADELVIQASVGRAMTYTILRPSNVFGSKMTNQSLRRLIELVKRKLFFYVGRPGAITTYVHVEDVVAALVICAIAPRAKGQIFNLSSDCTLEDIVKHTASLLGVRQPWLRIPEPLINIPLGLVSSMLKNWVNVPSLNVLLLRTRYPTDKIENELGFKFSRPLPAGIEDLVREFI